MEKYAITISRQFASMGRSIAQELSKELGIEFLDRDIVDETAARMGATVSEVSNQEEELASKFSYRMFPLGMGVPGVKDELFQVQKNIIRDFAKKESCIIVGRCGSYVLKDHPNLLKVYVYAPYEKRFENCINELGMTEKVAAKTIAAVDTARENYHKNYIPGYVNATVDSDICINTATYSIEEAVALIKEAAKYKFGLE